MKLWVHVVLILLVNLPSFMYAANSPMVRIHRGKSAETVWVGQKVSFAIQLLSPTFFSGAPKFDFPQVSGVVLMKVADRPVIGSENIDGNTYSSQQHEFVLYPHRPGKIIIPSITVRFGVAGVGGVQPVEHALQAAEFHFEATMPPGMENFAFVISASQLTVKENWEPEPTDAKVGDAFTRKVIFQASGIPGMAFPPLPNVEIPGVAVYPKKPLVQDKSERGEFTGKREETITYVLEKPDKITLPAMDFHWWNTASEELNKVELPAIELQVTAVPGAQASDTSESSGTPISSSELRPYGMSLVFILVITSVFMKYRHAIVRWWTDRQGRRWQSEPAYFSRLMSACRNDDPVTALHALMAWLEQVYASDKTPSFANFLKKHPHEALARDLTLLQDAVLKQQHPWSGNSLADLLKDQRKRILPATKEGLKPLPDLNPR